MRSDHIEQCRFARPAIALNNCDATAYFELEVGSSVADANYLSSYHDSPPLYVIAGGEHEFLHILDNAPVVKNFDLKIAFPEVHEMT